MTEQEVIDISARTIWTAVEVAAPALLATMVIGLIVSIIQAATQINEQTLSFIPKVIAMTAATVIAGPWILRTVLVYTTNILASLSQITR